jgi:MOSC domain-containing protein YiiM
MTSIRAIAIKHRPRESMQSVDGAHVDVASGIAGDFRGSQPDRQVTILSETSWRKTCAALDADLPWTLRRANLLVDGVEFDESWVGRRVRIGDVELEITGETDPCSRMDEQHPGLTAALDPDWRGGVCCKVTAQGNIAVGDSVEFT